MTERCDINVRLRMLSYYIQYNTMTQNQHKYLLQDRSTSNLFNALISISDA